MFDLRSSVDNKRFRFRSNSPWINGRYYFRRKPVWTSITYFRAQVNTELCLKPSCADHWFVWVCGSQCIPRVIGIIGSKYTAINDLLIRGISMNWEPGSGNSAQKRYLFSISLDCGSRQLQRLAEVAAVTHYYTWQVAEVPPTPSELRDRLFFRWAKRDPGGDPRSLPSRQKGSGVLSGIPFRPSKQRPFSELRRSWGSLHSFPRVVVSYNYQFRKFLELSGSAIERCREKKFFRALFPISMNIDVPSSLRSHLSRPMT